MAKTPWGLRTLPSELVCLIMPRTSAAAKVSLHLEVCRCGGCDGCWRFRGEHDDCGYGVVRGAFSRRARRAHVALWVHEQGPLADGATLDHQVDRGCRHRDCCRPAHLELSHPAGAQPEPSPVRPGTVRTPSRLPSGRETFDA